MASTKAFRDFILEQLSEVPDVTCRPMMGEFLLYSNGVLFGGIYDDRLLIKSTPATARFNLPTTLPYPGAKTYMYLIEDVDNPAFLAEIINMTVEGLR